MNKTPFMRLPIAALIAIFGMFFMILFPGPIHGQQQEGLYYSNDWVATDALGRELPDYEEVGPLKDGKYVGVFYFIWHGAHGDSIFDITRILEENPDNPQWGPRGAYHFWGEPEQGYHHSMDPWVIRRDMQMLSNADVDFIFFDVTNSRLYTDVVKEVCRVCLEMNGQGIRTPQLCFLTNKNSGKIMNQAFDELYSIANYTELWFRWQGKPLIMGEKEDPVLRPEVKEYFTIRKSWAWTNTREETDHWQWLDQYPQDYGWHSDPSIPEQITVSVAHHPMNPLGKSYHNGEQPSILDDYTTPYTDHGLQFAEQWERALEVDPQVLMVTQWNEWIAGRFEWRRDDGFYAGKPIKKGEWRHFVDVFSREFNRDIAPMKGGYTDNYYYQMIDNVRKFKGMDPPEATSGALTMSIDSEFGEWEDHKPLFIDPPGDVMHRDFKGYDPDDRYVNCSGRNDILGARVSHDDQNLYFFVECEDLISSPVNEGWMLLFIDADKDKNTGWEGYDYLINQGEITPSKSPVKRWTGTSWEQLGLANMATKNNALELSVPRKLFGMKEGELDFFFKWADNPGILEDVSVFFLNGDAAPDRRFNYHYHSK